MNVKAQSIINAARWVEDTHGRDMLGTILRQCSPTVRDRYIESIAINWHPVAEYNEFLEVCERVLGSGIGTAVSEAIGAYSARAATRGVLLRLAQYLAKPEFLMRRVATLWRQYNDEGDMVVLQFDERLVRFEIRGLKTTYPLLCATITGWATETSAAIGFAAPVTRHISCKARGGQQCQWEIHSRRSGQLSSPSL